MTELKPPSSLVKVKNNRINPRSLEKSGFCGRLTGAGPVGDEIGRFQYRKLRCKSWGCKKCGPKKVRALKKGINENATALDLTRFLTVTVDHKGCTAEESWDLIKATWAKFRLALKRKIGVDPDFIWVMEPHKDGYAHMHILIDRFIDQRWISKKFAALGGGKIADIRKVRSVGAYMSKYFTKSFMENYFKPGARRYGSSRGIILIPRNKVAGWKVFAPSLEQIIGYAQGTLRNIFEDKDGELIGVEIEYPNFYMVPSQAEAAGAKPSAWSEMLKLKGLAEYERQNELRQKLASIHE